MSTASSNSLINDKVRHVIANIRQLANRQKLVSTSMPDTSDRSSITDEQQQLVKFRKSDISVKNVLVETELLKKARQRTFSHWYGQNIPSEAQMIYAGFFYCNVADRVICLYCNLICQQWISEVDDPKEVHRNLSPQCVYVQLMCQIHEKTPISIINQNSHAQSQVLSGLQFNSIAHTSAIHSAYAEIPKRVASFALWPTDSLPPVDDLVRAGFFYTGTQTVVTCFYCNGSLQNWGANDNPLIEHTRWFPHCSYAKQLCGASLYRKIQQSKKIIQERAKIKQSNEQNSGQPTKDRQLLAPDENTLLRLVAGRLDLPISQRLIQQGYKIAIVKRVWEDQLRLKQDDFASEIDVYVACLILQRQIDCINGNKENIVVPNVRMKSIREKEQPRSSNILSAVEEISSKSAISTMDVEVTATFEDDSSSSNLCSLCLTEDKGLAVLPCGHVATCVPCGYSLKICPICRQRIEGFVRVYM
ncbi:unnamed protein product [Adineta ricciae]|uniref:RING-type domain-containing protein n=1 Tax=Adineta ricciae TaxID=249248 RepID=A0A814L492_ADIRI|nr:unnamed protein product [Adineta ricciae]CAF1302301.1 unnamed protein product [Adineta ricciae]